MKRSTAAVLIATGLLLGGIAGLFLPPDRGRYQFALEVSDPRPLAAAEMPDALRNITVLRRTFLSRKTMPVPALDIIRLTPPPALDDVPRIAMLPHLSSFVTAADCGLGSASPADDTAVAGANTGLSRGRIDIGPRTLEIAGLLAPQGALFDSALWTNQSPALLAELQSAGWRAQRSYLLLPMTWRGRAQVLAQLQADPDLLPAPSAEINNPSYPPPLSHAFEQAVSLLLILAGIFLLAWQLRGLSRAEISSSLGRE